MMEIDFGYSYAPGYNKADIKPEQPGSKWNRPHKSSRKRGAGFTKSRKSARTGKSSSRR